MRVLKSSVILYFSFLLIISFVVPTFAQNKTIDVIYLHGGSIIKGNIIEIVPNKTVKIRTIGGGVFVFKMSEVKNIKKGKMSFRSSEPTNSNVSSRYVPDKYSTQKAIGRYGSAATLGLTLIGSAAMGDEMFSTTVIPIVGPFITMIRIENDPDYEYLSGGKVLLITSGALQVSFFSYWMYYVIKDSSYKDKHRISFQPNFKNPGVILVYRF